MATNAQHFLVKLEDPAFKAAFEAADAAGRQKLLDRTGLLITLKEAEAIFSDQAGELDEASLKHITGGYAIFYPPAPDDDEIP